MIKFSLACLLLAACSTVNVEPADMSETCSAEGSGGASDAPVCPVCPEPPPPACDAAQAVCYADAAECMSLCTDTENVASCVKLCATALPECEALCPMT